MRETYVADWEAPEDPEVVAGPTLIPFDPTETATPFEVVTTSLGVAPEDVTGTTPMPLLPTETTTPPDVVTTLEITLPSAAVKSEVRVRRKRRQRDVNTHVTDPTILKALLTACVAMLSPMPVTWLRMEPTICRGEK